MCVMLIFRLTFATHGESSEKWNECATDLTLASHIRHIGTWTPNFYSSIFYPKNLTLQQISIINWYTKNLLLNLEQNPEITPWKYKQIFKIQNFFYFSFYLPNNLHFIIVTAVAYSYCCFACNSVVVVWLIHEQIIAFENQFWYKK